MFGGGRVKTLKQSRANVRLAEPITSAEVQRFWSKVEKSDGCWLWVAARSDYGHGIFTLDRVSIRAHRVSYTLAYGYPGDDLVVDHLCGNPACVNPEHLELVTHRVNTLRGTSAPATNARKACCPTCGGPYVTLSGSRVCRPCRAANLRRWRAEKRRERR